jgi:hypothetical protein
VSEVVAKQVLHQQRLLERRVVRVDDFTMTYRNVLFNAQRERRVPLEELLVDQPSWGTRVHWGALIFTALFGLFAYSSLGRAAPNWAFGSIWIICTVGAAMFAWMRSGSYVSIPVANDEPIELYGAEPSVKATEEFMEALSNNVRDYAVKKYGAVSEVLPADLQFQRITWLRDRNFISSDDRDQLIERVRRATGASRERQVGFLRGSKG